ncbi:MAG: serine/threonine protein kinase, partial [Candidatus Obscuribacterales bacterium]|nr:serine/threonine protein kinase [Candidatus Obscuribacterales bacterium]
MQRRPSGSGRLTQWIFACTCGNAEESGEQPAVVSLCKECGKRIGEGREGSLTSYIFRSDICSCQRPEPENVLASKFEDPKVADISGSDMGDEQGIEVDEHKFPIDRYLPLSELGKGAGGTIYLCQDKLLNQRVAVKVLSLQQSDQIVSFQREARATARLDHANIVKLLNFGTVEGSIPYMVLEYVKGVSLDRYLADNGVLDIDSALRIFCQLCQALQYAHDHDVYHRDLKPSNIIVLDPEGNNPDVRIIDFGIARLATEDQESTVVQGRNVVGTPAYMAPDQIAGRSFDSRSEVYSLGCVLYESLSGRPPFIAEHSLSVLMMHAEEPPPPITEFIEATEYTDAIEHCLSRCLAKDPDDRYSSVAELGNTLKVIGALPGPSDRAHQSDAKEAAKRETPSRIFAIAIMSTC